MQLARIDPIDLLRGIVMVIMMLDHPHDFVHRGHSNGVDGGVNIGRFHLGRRERGGEAMAVIEIDAPLQSETLDELRSFSRVISALQIKL